ncbi:MAG: hypothetical protein V1760_03355 [Candidatus Peregrinibacteria bacterium]
MPEGTPHHRTAESGDVAALTNFLLGATRRPARALKIALAAVNGAGVTEGLFHEFRAEHPEIEMNVETFRARFVEILKRTTAAAVAEVGGVGGAVAGGALAESLGASPEAATLSVLTGDMLANLVSFLATGVAVHHHEFMTPEGKPDPDALCACARTMAREYVSHFGGIALGAVGVEALFIYVLSHYFHCAPVAGLVTFTGSALVVLFYHFEQQLRDQFQVRGKIGDMFRGIGGGIRQVRGAAMATAVDHIPLVNEVFARLF